MKNKILITITTLNGSKQYTITQLLKKFLIFFAVFTIALVIFTFFFIKYLNSVIESKNQALISTNKEMQLIIKQKQQLEHKITKLENNITALEKTISKKEQILAEVNDRVADIERIIQFAPPKDMHINQRLNLAKLNLLDKKFILHNIPNGSPVPYIGISSRFGWRIHPILHKREFHTGLDMRAKFNTPVRATADGIVEFAHYHKRSGYGNLLIIDHNFGFKTMFGHLHKIVVKQGDFIKKGQIIAYSGNTGLSSGPHLHYEIRYLGMVLDPMVFVKWNLQNYNSIFKKERKIKWQSLIKAIQWQKQLIQQH
ncbi:MAG: peptidoglycan DD-metalloendopeptidase family protein [Epsilonproteobacteria bacterium]|nr:peptidoglycan DD-metalloendopeptidase family protein [Campylobacterota bacterium]